MHEPYTHDIYERGTLARAPTSSMDKDQQGPIAAAWDLC